MRERSSHSYRDHVVVATTVDFAGEQHLLSDLLRVQNDVVLGLHLAKAIYYRVLFPRLTVSL